MKSIVWFALGSVAVLAGCGPTAEEQRAMDQQRCGGFGFAPGTEAYATCMMKTAQQRQDEQAADQRAAADRAAAARRARDAQQAAQDRAARQNASSSASSSSSSSPSPFGPNPVDKVRDQIQKDLDKMQGSE